MAKINKEEYAILKGLDVEWNWIARDERGILGCYMKKPKKYKLILKLWSDNISPPKFIDDSNFQFIQWEDEDPYNIQELIEEYEKEYHIENAKIVKLDASKLVARDASDYEHFYKRLGESKETEMKDLKWLRRKVLDNKFMGHTIHIDVLFELMDELDELEALSEKWVSDNAVVGQYPDGMGHVVPAYKLQNLLVPKQEREQKYLVNILDEGIGAYLIYYPKSGNYGVTGILDNNKGITRFTEQEIKDYDERYIPFMVPVDEVNND